ncbi:hypothetical protein J1N35_028883 [Gossypium stocksii]|uniref:Uncharacterized protein n=1 Tax=Gossypium stocksii TaxID=47602 RepID=A0A9D3UX22_9ROSI|nr:hypothetical protein J1N35_028883 [Gossypium stocksii]
MEIKIHFLAFKKIKKPNLGPILLFWTISRIKEINVSNLENLGPRNQILQPRHIGFHVMGIIFKHFLTKISFLEGELEPLKGVVDS